MTPTGRPRNERLLAVIRACGWSYDGCVHAVRAVATESGEELVSLHRSHVAHWVKGVRPSGSMPYFLAEAASRRLGYGVNPGDLGLAAGAEVPGDASVWERDPVAGVLMLGRADLERRELAKTALYSLAALAVPLDEWQETAERGRWARDGGAAVGAGDVDAVRQMVAGFSEMDERFGGGQGRIAVVAYLSTDVAGYLRGSFASDADRRAMFSAAAELAYLAGWKTFDSGHHGLAQRYYVKALRLANEADDGPLGGFILRAMAHQAVDLGHGEASVQLADSALTWSRRNATPGVSALFTVVKARGHAAERQGADVARALVRAEGLLGRVDWAAEPAWIKRMGFGEPSLANQTGQALRDLGDLAGAERQFRRAAATRDGHGHRRIHALTLSYLADVQFARNEIAEACTTWSKSIDATAGVRSGRMDHAVRNLRRRLATLGTRRPGYARQLDRRAATILASSGEAR